MDEPVKGPFEMLWRSRRRALPEHRCRQSTGASTLLSERSGLLIQQFEAALMTRLDAGLKYSEEQASKLLEPRTWLRHGHAAFYGSDGNFEDARRSACGKLADALLLHDRHRHRLPLLAPVMREVWLSPLRLFDIHHPRVVLTLYREDT